MVGVWDGHLAGKDPVSKGAIAGKLMSGTRTFVGSVWLRLDHRIRIAMRGSLNCEARTTVSTDYANTEQMNLDKEIRTMIREDTMEEKAYEGLLDQKLETLSEAARNILGEATTEAYKYNLVRSYAYQPQEYDEAMERMRFAATGITGRDHETLSEIVRAGLLAAASIDPEDSTLVGHKVNRGNLHWYYKQSSLMVDEILEEDLLKPMQQDEE